MKAGDSRGGSSGGGKSSQPSGGQCTLECLVSPSSSASSAHASSTHLPPPLDLPTEEPSHPAETAPQPQVQQDEPAEVEPMTREEVNQLGKQISIMSRSLQSTRMKQQRLRDGLTALPASSREEKLQDFRETERDIQDCEAKLRNLRETERRAKRSIQSAIQSAEQQDAEQLAADVERADRVASELLAEERMLQLSSNSCAADPPAPRAAGPQTPRFASNLVVPPPRVL